MVNPFKNDHHLIVNMFYSDFLEWNSDLMEGLLKHRPLANKKLNSRI